MRHHLCPHMLLLHARRFQWLPHLTAGSGTRLESLQTTLTTLGAPWGTNTHVHTLLRLLSISPTICVYFIVQVHLLSSRERRVITIRRRRISRIIMMLIIIIRATSSPSSAVLLSYVTNQETAAGDKEACFHFWLVFWFAFLTCKSERGRELSLSLLHVIYLTIYWII